LGNERQLRSSVLRRPLPPPRWCRAGQLRFVYSLLSRWRLTTRSLLSVPKTWWVRESRALRYALKSSRSTDRRKRTIRSTPGIIHQAFTRRFSQRRACLPNRDPDAIDRLSGSNENQFFKLLERGFDMEYSFADYRFLWLH